MPYKCPRPIYTVEKRAIQALYLPSNHGRGGGDVDFDAIKRARLYLPNSHHVREAWKENARPLYMVRIWEHYGAHLFLQYFA